MEDKSIIKKRALFIFFVVVGITIAISLTYLATSTKYKRELQPKEADISNFQKEISRLGGLSKLANKELEQLKDQHARAQALQSSVWRLEEANELVYEELNQLKAQYARSQRENELLRPLIADEKKFATFSNEELGFSFKYPVWFGELDFGIGKGETGKGFGGVFQNVPLEFGGLTMDYSAGRGGWFTDYRGGERWTEDEDFVKTLQVQGGVVTIAQGSSDCVYGGCLAEGTFGAVVKLKGDEFHGVAFQAGRTMFHKNDDREFSLSEFESVLETLVIK